MQIMTSLGYGGAGTEWSKKEETVSRQGIKICTCLYTHTHESMIYVIMMQNENNMQNQNHCVLEGRGSESKY
jgi:hypothetical protein